MQSNILLSLPDNEPFTVEKNLVLVDLFVHVKLAAILYLARFLFQIFVFQVKSHPDHPTFQQCVSIGFFESDVQEIMYNVFSVTAMFFFPLVVIIFTYAMILWKITTKSKEHRLQSKYSGFSMRLFFLCMLAVLRKLQLIAQTTRGKCCMNFMLFNAINFHHMVFQDKNTT